jgi:hypothetical protein
VDSTIHVFLNLAGTSPGLPAPSPAVVPLGDASDVFSRMDAEWNASLQLEPLLAAAAKQLNGTLLRIDSLNRDLSSEESRVADQLDKHEWQDTPACSNNMNTAQTSAMQEGERRAQQVLSRIAAKVRTARSKR